MQTKNREKNRHIHITALGRKKKCFWRQIRPSNVSFELVLVVLAQGESVFGNWCFHFCHHDMDDGRVLTLEELCVDLVFGLLSPNQPYMVRMKTQTSIRQSDMHLCCNQFCSLFSYKFTIKLLIHVISVCRMNIEYFEYQTIKQNRFTCTGPECMHCSR